MLYHSPSPSIGASGETCRILIYGVTGSGKTALAKRLGERTGLPWHSVDEITWEPGWVAVPDDEQRRRTQQICDGPQWILDTAYAKWLDIPLARVELIVGLDYPRWLSLSRLVVRSVSRLFDKRPVCNGNHETLKTFFSKDSIILWHFHSFARKRGRILKWIADPNAPPVVRLRRPRETDAWLSSFVAPKSKGS